MTVRRRSGAGATEGARGAVEPPLPGPARPSTPSRRLERATKRFLSRLLAAALRPAPATARDVAALAVHRLLVLRPHNQMGDMVCALPSLAALRRAWPDAHLVFVVNPLAEELLRNHPDVDELLVLRKQDLRHPARLASFLARLRRPRPDLAVVLSTVSFSTTTALVAWASGARLRAGASSLPFGSHLSRAVFHLELAAGSGESEVEHQLSALAPLGIPLPPALPRLAATPEAGRRARAFLEERAPGAGPYVVAHAGAGKRSNLWPVEHFAAVLRALASEHAARIVLTEGPGDAAIVTALAGRLDGAARWRAPLDATFGLLAEAGLVLSNDTGIAHVAAALGAPTLVVFGPTDPVRWRPAGAHVQIVQAPSGRITDVDPTRVLQVARAMLGRDASRREALS